MRTYTLFLTFFFLLSSPALAVIEIRGSGHPSGPGACDGFIDVLAEGSAGPLRLEISGPGEYSDFVEGIDGGYTFEGLCSGAYEITVINAYVCKTLLTVHLDCSLDVSLETVSACPGTTNGSVSLEVVNGTAPYTYSWSNGATSANIGNLPPGEYCVTVTDAVGCATVEL